MTVDQVVIARLTILKILLQLQLPLSHLPLVWSLSGKTLDGKQAQHSQNAPQLQNGQRKAKQKWGSILSFQGAFSALLFWQQGMMSCKRHRAPTRTSLMDLRTRSKGRAFFRATSRSQPKRAASFDVGSPFFTILPLLSSCSKPQKLILTLPVRSYTQTNSHYRCLLFPVCPYRISLSCTNRTIFYELVTSVLDLCCFRGFYSFVCERW